MPNPFTFARTPRRIARRAAILLLGLLPLFWLGTTSRARMRPDDGLRAGRNLAATGQAASAGLAQTDVLELGKTIEREMTGGQTHMYQIKLTAGQFLRIEVEQRGIDVIVALFGPDDKQIIAVNETDGAQGTETIFVVDEADRTYRLEVRSPEKDAATGRYETKIAELRIATPQDRARWSAKKAAFEGDQFRKKKDAASLRQAIEKYQEALPSWRAAADRKGEAGTLYTLGLVFMSLTERTSALECFNRALPLFREMGDRVGRIGEADSLNVIGIIYGDFGEWRKALNYYNQALTLFRAESHRVGEAGGLNSIASIYWGEGEFEKALEYYNQALTIVRELKNLEAEATILGNISAVYNAMHEYQRAIEYALRSLELAQALMDHEGEGYVLNEIGVIYARLNEFPTALRYYNQALAIRQKIGDRLGEQMTLDNIGTLHYRSRDFEKALDFYGRALALAKLIQDPSGEAYILANLGKVYDELNDQRKALDYFEQALNLSRRLGDRPLEASILSNIGEVYASPGSPGEKQKPLDYYRQALSLSKTIGGDRHTEALTLYRMAQEERGLGNLAVAREQMEKSLAITESLRTRVASQELRASYFSKALEEYGFYMDLLMQQHRIQPDAGHDVAALQANERGRARGLLELLTEAQVDVRQGVATELLSREKRLRLQLNEKAGELLKLKSGKQSKERAALVEKEYDALLTEYQQFEGEIRQKSPGYAAITQPKPLSPAEIQQQVLSADTLLLEYALGKERSYLWAVSVDSIKSYELPKRATIKDAAENLLAVLSVPKRTVELDSKTQAAAADLGQMLLAPVVAQLGKKRLVIVADGALQYVPFAVLPKPGVAAQSRGAKSRGINRGAPLIVDHEIISLPSASTIAVLRRELAGRQAAPKIFAALADPVFNENEVDERLNEAARATQSAAPAQPKPSPAMPSAQTRAIRALLDAGASDSEPRLRLPRLWASGEEAVTIAKLAPPGMSKVSLGFEANHAAATSPELAEYRHLLFATHGWLDDKYPELTGILLSLVDEQKREQNGLLRLGEVYNLRLQADLVTLSACQTALGKDIRGEGLVGLTRGFMYAGAARVAASLWQVEEEGTKQLMIRFYRGMLGKQKLRPAAALRQAQISMLRQPEWRSPYYWSAFILQGEWR